MIRKHSVNGMGLVLAWGAVLGVSHAQAHDIWLTAQGDAGAQAAHVNYGDLDKRELASLDKIVRLDLLTPAGSVDLRKGLADVAGVPVLATGPLKNTKGAAVSLTYDNGFWLTRPNDEQETNTSLLMEPKGLDPHWTVKYGKLLLGPDASNRIAGVRGEFIVLKDPFTLSPGQKLPIRLVIDGKPIAGTRVRYCDGTQPIPAEKIPFVKTDKDGVAEIPLERKGAYLIVTDPTVPPTYPALSKGDHIYVALTFDLSK